MSRKYIDRKMASRASLGSRFSVSRSTSPSLLPPISARKFDNFTLSVKKHMNNCYSLNPQSDQLHSIRYYLDKQLANNPNEQPQTSLNMMKARRLSLISEPKENPYRISLPAYLKEIPQSVRYEEKVNENIKRYGKGMLRHQHRNSLTKSSKEKQLLDLHYRLKKQRESAIIAREERKGQKKLKKLLDRYDSL